MQNFALNHTCLFVCLFIGWPAYRFTPYPTMAIHSFGFYLTLEPAPQWTWPRSTNATNNYFSVFLDIRSLCISLVYQEFGSVTTLRNDKVGLELVSTASGFEPTPLGTTTQLQFGALHRSATRTSYHILTLAKTASKIGIFFGFGNCLRGQIRYLMHCQATHRVYIIQLHWVWTQIRPQIRGEKGELVQMWSHEG